MLSAADIAAQDETFHRRDQFDALRQLPVLGHLFNLGIAHPKIAQAICISLDAAHSLLRYRTRKRHSSRTILARGSRDRRRRREEARSNR